MSIDPYQTHSSRFDVADWSDVSARAALQLIAESVAQMVGFEVALISAVQGDVIVSVAIEGGDDVREAMRNMRTPLHTIATELALAQDWGRFKFIDHAVVERDDLYLWVPDLQPSDEPDAWHPLDALLAPLHTEDGELCGLLSIDLPLSRKRPDATQRSLLERYAAQAERALQNALAREELAQRLRLAEVARNVVRLAVSQPQIDVALEECRPALLEGFRADDLTIRTYADIAEDTNVTSPQPASDAVRALLTDVSHRCWELQRAGVLDPRWQDRELVDEEDYAALLAALVDLGHSSGMIVPIGAGQRCLGHLVLLRKDPDLPWTADERAGALEVTRDVGQAVLASRNLAREQRLVSELRELDRYKSELLSTVSHELKNPLGAVVGHLELVSDDPFLSRDTRFSVDAMERATLRMTRVVDDLLTLARLEDPEHCPDTAPIDLRGVVDAALDASRLAAERRQLTVHLDAPHEPVWALGDEDGLGRVLTNLLSNAVKYTPRGGSVHVGVGARGEREVEVCVADEGIGISPADQARLFTEFFRSTNPVALAEPGTGLGLTISARIVESLGGRITVESTLGTGSTFRVVLPVPAPGALPHASGPGD